MILLKTISKHSHNFFASGGKCLGSIPFAGIETENESRAGSP
jgi:hypothetical protein